MDICTLILPLAITCDSILSFKNGIISYSPDMVSPFVLGTVAAHDCDEGFSLVGIRMRVCEIGNGTTGIWSGVSPYCEGELMI